VSGNWERVTGTAKWAMKSAPEVIADLAAGANSIIASMKISFTTGYSDVP
jgi:hypothetical protein